MNKFTDKKMTAKGEERAFVVQNTLDTLWFNTGTRCNLQCPNCYIESSPKNDRIEFITTDEVSEFLDELEEINPTCNIGLTGGEPFVNPQIIEIMQMILARGHQLTILTNGHRPFTSKRDDILKLAKQYDQKLVFRVSLDSVHQKEHEANRGANSFALATDTLKWLHTNNIRFSIAGRSSTGQDIRDSYQAFNMFLNESGIDVDFLSSNRLIIFPEMSGDTTVPEITTKCWSILKVTPSTMMCASERMVVKKKGDERPTVMPCTLLAYNKEFELGETIKDAKKKVYLNHRFCSQFCVLGGASCSSTS